MSLPSVITIDGPVASGKTSVGKILANALGYFFLDTGIMYRALTWAVLDQNIDVKNESDVGNLANEIKIVIKVPTISDGRLNDILIDSKDVTWKIRELAVNENVSQVSKYAQVRKAMTKQQRVYGEKGNIVMAGRDIGTVVMPKAELKIFLKASVRERAIRRFEEERSRGKNIDLKDVMRNVELRDAIDSNREIAPLIPATDAIIIDTDGKDKEEVVEEILEIIRKK